MFDVLIWCVLISVQAVGVLALSSAPWILVSVGALDVLILVLTAIFWHDAKMSGHQIIGKGPRFWFLSVHAMLWLVSGSLVLASLVLAAAVVLEFF